MNLKKSNLSRRTFLKGATATSVSAGIVGATSSSLLLSGCSFETYDYVVVGAGPGGAPVAANLARAGYTVAIIEAGLDPKGTDVEQIDSTVTTIYNTPVFFTATAEHPLLSWDFYVNNYDNDEQARKNSKYVEGKGILYPRGACLGGSMSHNALIFVYPHDSDFNEISDITGDGSWDANKMREYFIRMENCTYCDVDATGHGFDGYISSSVVENITYDLFPDINDLSNAGAIIPSSFYVGNEILDINHPLVAEGDVGKFLTPMHVGNNKRVTVRDYLVETQEEYPDNLTIITNALATKVLTRKKAAIGIEYMVEGGFSYSANKLSIDAQKGVKKVIYASKEVILSGGAFNTPQLLKLSGIGPAEELATHGIEVICDLPGVGENLQDRYEVTVGVDLKEDLEIFSNCQAFQADDPCLTSYLSGEWETDGNGTASYHGPYASNVVLATRIAKSSESTGMPDLFLVGLPAAFSGYFPGFSQVSSPNRWTWLVLKAHNKNSAGTVKLRSASPLDTPIINFKYFEEGNDGSGSDLRAVVEGIKMVRESLSLPEANQHIDKEVIPGAQVYTQQDLEDFVRNEAWGHHASCTCKIGSDDDPMAVLDSRFRVRGVKKLRVVDASAFPKLPGFFPITSILMISEKASDVIIEDAKNHNRRYSEVI